jgi:hypothetical protein
MQTQKTHWPSILILLVIIPSAALFLMASLGLGITSIITLATQGNNPTGTMIASASAFVEGLLLAIVAWLVLEKTRKLAEAEVITRLPYADWQIFATLGIGGLALLIGGLVSYSEIAWLNWLILPTLTVIIIAMPIWILLGVGTTALDFGTRWRAWGIFGLGMTLGPLLMLIFEGIAAMIFVIIAMVILFSNPNTLSELIRLAPLLKNETNPDVILPLIAPYIINPGLIAVALSFFALVVPLIEEALKPLGLLSGAAYALVESLGASGQGGTNWMAVVLVRAGTSLLHIITSGLMGWAIVAAWREKHILRLLATYATVVLIHGIWNASAIGSGIAVMADSLGGSSYVISIVPAAVCGLTVLAIGMLAMLIASNRKARFLSAPLIPAENPPIMENDSPNNGRVE